VVVARHCCRATPKRETPDSDEESDVLRMADSGVNTRGRQTMFPNRGVEGVPSVGEHQESGENQDIAENVKRR
jgi:hypothetical protein